MYPHSPLRAPTPVFSVCVNIVITRVGQNHPYIRIYSVCTVFLWHGKLPHIQSNTVCARYFFGREVTTHTVIYRVGPNHIYTVYIRYFWLGNHQIYGVYIRIYTVLANPSHIRCVHGIFLAGKLPHIQAYTVCARYFLAGKLPHIQSYTVCARYF